MPTALWVVVAFVAGVITLPLLLFLLRDVLPPTLFTPSDWDD